MENTIPHYPESRGISLDDKPLFDRLFFHLQPNISEFSFANLFLFRVVHDYRVTLVGDALVVLGQGYDRVPYFLPPLCGDIPSALHRLWESGLTLYGADDSFRDRYLRDQDLLVTEDRDNFDYLHLREELATLSGSRYHKKKNRVNYFTVRHRYQVEQYRPHHLEGALALLDEWVRVRLAQGSSSIRSEMEGAGEALRLCGELGLCGVVVMVEGAVKGFALGERLNRETAVCHFEKGDLFMDGLYQLLNREFCRLLFTDCRFINREQDLGEPQLRQAKLSYHPDGFIVKYRARRR